MTDALDYCVLIPARYASTRLPGKALLDIAGKPLVVRVAERALASGARRVIVATDHEAVRAGVRAHGIEVCMTRADHASGTDRLAEAAQALALEEEAIVVNLQGDEPLMEPELIHAVAQRLHAQADIEMATACYAIAEAEALFNPNIVKVVLDAHGNALYFSRAPIPYARDAFATGERTIPPGLPAYHHIGIYAYRVGFLKRYAALPSPAVERLEALEQLRALWHGFRISVVVSEATPIAGVDTEQDLERTRRLFDQRVDSP